MIVLLEFLSSLEFVKEKYRKQYHYERLIISFLMQLNDFIDERNRSTTISKDE
jgi:hypothetical protein